MKIIIPFTIFLLIITFFYCKKYPSVIETFNSPSPTITTKSNTKHLKMDFIYENPEYKDTKIENGQIVKYDWKKNLENKLCNPDDINESPTISNNECSCITTGDQNICGKEFNRYIYECPNKCPKCKDCLTTNPHTSDIECLNIEGRDKCDLLREKMIFSKEYYTPNDRKTLKKSVVRNDKAKDLFQTTLYNDFLTNNNILIRINPIADFFDEINKIVVQDVYFDNIKREYNIFYEDNKEVDIIIIPTNSDSKLNISLKITGYYKLNKNYNFTLERIINIYEYKKPVDLEKTEEDEQSKPLILTSAYGNDYQNNYLGESVIKTEHLYKNPTYINEIKDKQLGEFERKEILDSPETWKERVDINRPWISTFSEVFTDMFAEYNFDKKEKEFELDFIKQNLKSIEKEKDKLSQEELQSMFGPSASFDFYDEFSKKNVDMKSLLKMKLEKDKIRFQKQKEKEKEEMDYLFNIIKNRRKERYYYLINIHNISISPSPSPSKNNISSILKYIKKNNNNIVVLGKDNQYKDKTNILNILKKKKIQNRTTINGKTRILIIDNDYIKLLYSENRIDEKNNFKNIIKKALINKMEIVTYIDFLTDLGKNILITGKETFYKKILIFLLEKQGRIVNKQENKKTIFRINNSKLTLFNITNTDNITNKKNIVIRDNSIKSKPFIVKENGKEIEKVRVDRVTRFIGRNILTKTFSDNNTILIISEKEINEKDIKDEELHIPIMTHIQFKETLKLAF